MTVMKMQNDIRSVINAGDISLIWKHLGKTFGLDIRLYQNQFERYIASLPVQSSIAGHFVDFGAIVIEPVLNNALQRDLGYPTWSNMLHFLLKEKLATSQQQLNYYRSGAWKSLSDFNKSETFLSGHSV